MNTKPPQCQGCPAFLKGKSFVPGTGSKDATLALVGQGPGEVEAYQHRPFVGPSGEHLNKWLYAEGIQRSEIWLTNTVLCWLTRPGKTVKRLVNREPTTEEIAFCWKAHIQQELMGLPNLNVIVPVGIPSASTLLESKANERTAGHIIFKPDRDEYLRELKPRAIKGHSRKDQPIADPHPGTAILRTTS